MTTALKIILAQLNFTVGDISGNTTKIITAAQQACDNHADIIIFPELALSGYPPEDLVLRQDFAESIKHALQKIASAVPNILIVLGYPDRQSHLIYNSAAVLYHGKHIATHRKQKLPNYGVFDEKRYFHLGDNPTVFTYKNIKFGLTICEDIWFPEPIAQAAQAGAQVIISINASPFDYEKQALRVAAMRHRIKESHLPIIYCNLIGGQDDLIFDGNSLVINQQGEVCAQANFAREELFPIQLNPDLTFAKQKLPEQLSEEAHVYNALVLATRDYVIKNGFKKIVIGFSGGIDSALTLAIAYDALGKENVHALLLPSRYTSELSMNLAHEQLALLDVAHTTVSIEPPFQAFLESLPINTTDNHTSITAQNIQARCRAIILMAMSNAQGQLLLNTGNKSEMAVGYCTLYGDMAGAYAVLKDVFKTRVFKLATYRNSISAVIPQGIIDRPPSAELAPGQKDEDNIPPYAILDPILERYVEKDQSVTEIMAAGFDEATIYRVIDLVSRNEYKRRQSPPGPRISPRAFGRERRFPITSGFFKR